MPKPVLALPWGSRSITRTRFWVAASAVARLIAVVVLPTPPFWLTIAMAAGRGETLSGPSMGILSPQIFHAQDHAVGVEGAGHRGRAHHPGFLGENQFALPIASLEEQPHGLFGGKPRRQPEQIGQRRERPGSHDRRREGVHVLDSLPLHRDRDA